MTPEYFVASRQHAWGELRSLVQQAGSRKQLKALGGERVRKMGDLYRETAADLAVARLRFPNLVPDLADLVSEAHSLLYAPTPPRLVRLLSFITTGFPRLVRKEWRFVLVAVAFTLIPAALTFLWSLLQPDKAQVLLPEQMRSLVHSGPSGGRVEPGLGALSEGTFAFTEIFFNNVRVAFMSFAGGIVFGLGTGYILITNAVLLGALAGLMTYSGFSLEFWGLILPHGILELSAFAIAGAAGMRMGWALVDPGAMTRGKALAEASGQAVKLIVGVALFLFFAALIESYITPSSAIGPGLKIVIGLIVGAAFWLYLVYAGRAAAPATETSTALRWA